MVDRLDPGGEQPVQLDQVGHPVPAWLAAATAVVGGLAGDLDEELLAHGPEEPLDFAPALRASRSGVDQLDAQFRACPQQPGIDERRPVVDVDPVGDPARGERGTQRRGQAHGVLGEPEPVPHDRAGVVVEEGEHSVESTTCWFALSDVDDR